MREKLTNQRINKATCPEDKKQDFIFDTDSPRLAVRVTAGGARSFIFETKLNRKTIRKTIGACSVWTLEDARKEANRLQQMVDMKIDPREQEREEYAQKAALKAATQRAKQAAENAKKYTLKALCDTYADHLEAQGKKKSAAAVRSTINCHIIKPHPSLSETPARLVTAHQIAAAVRMVIDKGKDRTAGILRSYLSAAFNCGRKAPFDAKLPASFIPFEIENNPVDPVATIAIKPRNRTLNKEELKTYLNALGDDLIDQALKLAIFSGGQRLAQLLRVEARDYDPDSKILRLLDPKGRRAVPREHLLPLGQVAAGIVAGLIERAKEKGDNFLFGSKGSKVHWSTPGKRVAEISAAQQGESYDLRDIRRTTETMLAGLGVSRDIRAQLLSHGISGVQAAHYDRHGYIEEKRHALMKWERHLDALVTGETAQKIVQINR